MEVDSQGHALTSDQRGMPFDAPAPDIGAYQSVTVPLVVAATGDNASGSGKLDLRGAVDLADLDSAATTITFDSTVFASAQAIVLTAGQLELSNTGGLMTITGPSAGVSVSGNHASRVFQVQQECQRHDLGLDHHRRPDEQESRRVPCRIRGPQSRYRLADQLHDQQ